MDIYVYMDFRQARHKEKIVYFSVEFGPFFSRQ